ncbi:tRNA pseudouridine(54/55) synthase Pus10 [Candidatus Bipolaricaulota bacterium]|nr:tRNA pseudouridine(54/55) synthase Pus10 [Candidatus Bipolaricaulota bacterium]
MTTFEPQEVGELGAEILRAGPICDECLGRIASKLGKGLTNAGRGEQLRQHLAANGLEGVEGTCWVCGDLFDQIEGWVAQAVNKVQGLEFATYLFGVKLTPRLEQMEAFYEERFPSEYREPLKHSFNRMSGIAFERLLGHPVTVRFEGPQVSFVVDLNSNELTMHVLSLYVYGRYCKLERGIPQTKWPCRKCRGSGCEGCDFSGKQYPTSVEEIIASSLIDLAEASSACLHGAGREDIDARMLGTGRPFVLELLSPRRRSVDVSDAHLRVNELALGKVTVSPLKPANRRAVAWVKELRATKKYRAIVEFAEPVEADQLQNAFTSLTGRIEQRTPQRVSHRRADLVRKRRVHEISGQLIDEAHADIVVHGDGGLYIKELISSDHGRTNPSLSGRLGIQARVIDLDVLEVCSGDLPRSMELSDGVS